MRKKSHIALAKYLIKESRDKELQKHKYAFYFGSILPDIVPSFVYRRHEIVGTFPVLQKRILCLAGRKVDKYSAKYCRHLGEVSHYVADYFTFPHNKKFAGGFKAHCFYEEELKKKLRQHILSGRAASRKKKYIDLAGPEAVFDFLRKTHQEYLQHQNDVDGDISHIIPINSQVLKSIINFKEKA